jgi:hypothetical protein
MATYPPAGTLTGLPSRSNPGRAFPPETAVGVIPEEMR